MRIPRVFEFVYDSPDFLRLFFEIDEGVEDLRGRMKRHQWATNALWFGLARPSDRDWREGAKALIDAPILPPRDAEGVVDDKQHSSMEAIRELGRVALSAETPADRTDIYGQLLASCFQCHSSL